MYKFPLGAVLKHRKFLEDNLQKELGVLKRLLIDDKKKLSDIKNAKRKYSKELQFKQQKSITVSDNLLYIRFIDRLSKRLDRKMIEITRLDNSRMVVNVEKIQSLQSTPDTVITFTNNVKMIVREPLEEVSDKIKEYHRLVNASKSDTVTEYN